MSEDLWDDGAPVVGVGLVEVAAIMGGPGVPAGGELVAMTRH